MQAGVLRPPAGGGCRPEVDLAASRLARGQVERQLLLHAQSAEAEADGGQRTVVAAANVGPDHQVSRVGLDEDVAQDDGSVATEGDRLPDAAVGHVEAGPAGEDVVGPPLLAVGRALVVVVVQPGVDHPHRQVVVPLHQGGAGVELEGGEGLLVAAQVAAVEVDVGEVHDRPEAKRPPAAGVGDGEPAPVPGAAVEVEVALGLPQAGHEDLLGRPPVKVGQVVLAGMEVPLPVERRHPPVVELQRPHRPGLSITMTTLPARPSSAVR